MNPATTADSNPLEFLFASGERAFEPDESGYVLNIAGVYQDGVTRDWALRTCRRAVQLAGEQRIRNTWHEMSDLIDPTNLQQAVRAAQAADVIVVSMYAADELPMELRTWADSWMPRRRSRAGALTALVGVTESLQFQSVRTIEYLQCVARKARLDFFPRECKRPTGANSMDLLSQRAGGGSLAWERIIGRHYDAYSHWGLNE